jgi:hypothetical protein
MQTRWTAALVAMLIWPASASSAPLDQAACDGLKTERAALGAAGVDKDLDRGPEWAKTNLAPDRMKQVARLIEVEEQLSFRCGELATARPALKEPKPVQAAAVPGTKQAGAGTDGQAAALASPDGAPVKKKKKPAAQKKPKNNDAAAAGSGSTLSP